MNTRSLSFLLALWLACCAPQAPQSTQITVTPPAAAPAPPSPGPSEAQIAPGLWEVERLRRSDLLGAADDDRAAAAMFYYGYLAKARIRVIDVGKIDENVGKVMRQCAATPNITVPQAFRETLRSRRAPG